jgi:hypothetical protein
MREYLPTIRSALLACSVHLRTMEVLDDVVRIWNAAHTRVSPSSPASAVTYVMKRRIIRPKLQLLSWPYGQSRVGPCIRR